MATAYLPDWLQSSWQGSRVRFTLPPSFFFKFPPSHEPATLPPPPDNPNLAHPFTIPIDIYNAALSPHIPITIALVYATTITYLNSVNTRGNYQPWAISKTKIFTLGVLLHNLLLAAYSAWTFVGMVNALGLAYEHTSTGHGLAGTVDSLCKLHGPRGMGSAALYNSVTSQWGISNKVYHLSSTFLPEHSDVGRIWNEGLAFYGWLFYISKFYEVVDTLIIIAKGKKSSFLQTYHHAGAMMCMWAGIRYMSPPIWMFVMVNSFIHTVMYTFYFFTALRIRVPKPLKQALTTMQIAQFILGASFAFLHFFIKYQIPVSTPYVYHLGKKIVEGASSLGADAASEFTSAMAAATATADPNAWLKKFALRAAGREGLAENVLNSHGETFGVDAVHAIQDFVSREEVRYRNELQWVNCLDTSGQAFAIYLNIVYLLPLTWLFAQFFVNSYLKRSEAQRKRGLSDRVSMAGQSFTDARKGVGRRLSEAFEDSQGWNGDLNGDQVVIDGESVREQLRKLDEKMRKKADEVAVETPKAEDVKDMMKQGAEKAKQKAADVAADTKKAVQDIKDKVEDMDVTDVLRKARESVESSQEKSTSSTSQQSSTTTHQTMSSSSRSEVSSTTIFESSSISRSAQDEVIASSNIVRDADVDTKTGKKKQEVSNSSSVTSFHPSTNNNCSDIHQPSVVGNQSGFQSRPSTPNQPLGSYGSTSTNSSSSSEPDPFDEFSQTRPASSSTHPSPVKQTPSSSLSWHHPTSPTSPTATAPATAAAQSTHTRIRHGRDTTQPRSNSPVKTLRLHSMIPAPKRYTLSEQGGIVHAQSRKWHSRRRGRDVSDGSGSSPMGGGGGDDGGDVSPDSNLTSSLNSEGLESTNQAL